MKEVRPIVLLVDDDATTLEAFSGLLRQIGFEVLSSRSPVEAFNVLQARGNIEVLVSDFDMPQMNGEQLAMAAKKLRPKMPVFILSGMLPPYTYATPWDGWFIKGASINALVRQLESVTPQARGAA